MVSAGPNAPRRLTRPLALLTVLVAIGAVVLDVVQWYGAAPLWVDEEMIALNIRDRGFTELPGRLWLGQGAPLGWLFLQRTVILSFGSSETSLRLIPLLFGVAGLAAAVWVGERWMKRPAAVLFVLLCAMGQWMSHYRFELKHYSADALFALLLPAMAARAVEEQDPERARVRWTNWWIAAALAQWFAFGALLVTPACALLLTIVILTRHGARAALHFATAGIVWGVSFAAHYVLSLQYTSNSAHLRTYWADYVAPTGLGVTATIAWIAGQLGELAKDPGGTSLTVALWVGALCGLAVARRPVLAAMFASVPIMAFMLAALRVVPVSGRLALWIVPALYLGIALLFDAGVRSSVAAWRGRRWPLVAAGTIAVAGALYVAGNILWRGGESLDLDVPRQSNRGVNDRQAAAWLMARYQRGDVIMSTRLGWPAIWWYGDLPIRRPRVFMRDGSTMYEVSHERVRPGCRQRMREALESYRRVVVHVGFPDMPEGFFELLLHELSFFGTVVEQGHFADRSRTAVVELHPARTTELTDPADPPENGLLAGCVEVHTARRW